MQLFSHDAKADALAKAPLFRNLSRNDLVALAKVTEDLEVEEGKVLAREGDIVVIAGKGHEQGQEFEGGRKERFDDVTVAREALQAAAKAQA